MRLHIAQMRISISDEPGAEPVEVTVSMGVAALGSTWERTTGSQLTDLLAGADRALYQAKSAGRNHVVVVTDTEILATEPGRRDLPRLSAQPGAPGGRLGRRPAREPDSAGPGLAALKEWA
jgi:hypothetical protein